MSAVNPLFESLIRPVRPPVTFTFDGIDGRMDAHGFVSWGGMSFWVDSASPELRAAINAARQSSVMVEVPRVEVEQTILALMAAAEQIDQGRPAELGSSLLAHQLFASIKGLNACLDR